jgi:hypothetical protein
LRTTFAAQKPRVYGTAPEYSRTRRMDILSEMIQSDMDLIQKNAAPQFFSATDFFPARSAVISRMADNTAETAKTGGQLLERLDDLLCFIHRLRNGYEAAQ